MAIQSKPQADISADEVSVPSWIVNEQCAKQYHLGIAWFHCSEDEREPGPLSERYLLDNLRWMSKKGLFDGEHDDWALEHIGFMLGMLSQQR